jgi:hypothetical protein
MTTDAVLVVMLTAQGVLGGLDTLLNHEFIERLPYRRDARSEIGLHSIRESIYGCLFAGLGWFEWHGAAAAFIAALVLAEVLVTSCDEFIENRTRVLPQNERVLHIFLTLNLGVLIALLVPTLLEWSSQPAALLVHHRGFFSWALSALALAAFGWSLRDLFAWRRLGGAL